MASQVPGLLFLVVLLPVSSEGLQESCDETQYLVDSNICCNMCRPGTHVKTGCSQGVDTVCEPCKNGTWSKGLSYRQNCIRCTKCAEDKGLEYAQTCSATMNAKCVCQAGKFCVVGYSKPYCSMCKAYRSCPPGQGVLKGGTANSDVTCQVCPRGTFSDQVSSTQKCQAHSECGSGDVLRNGNATSDTLCSIPPLGSASTRKPSTEDALTTQLSLDLTSTSATLKTASVSATAPGNAMPSSGQQSTTAVTTAVFAAVGIAGVLVMACMLGACYHKKTKGSPEKEAQVENGCPRTLIPPPSDNPERQLLLQNGGPPEPSVSLSGRQTSSGPSPSPAAGASGCHVNQDDIHVELPQSPTAHQVVSVNVSITASASVGPLGPPGNGTPQPNGRPPPQPDSELPLSQEEVDICCQAKQSKEAHTAVPETGKFVC